MSSVTSFYKKQHDFDEMMNGLIDAVAEVKLPDPLPFMSDALMEIHRMRGTGWKPEHGSRSYKAIFQELLQSTQSTDSGMRGFSSFQFGDTTGGLIPDTAESPKKQGFDIPRSEGSVINLRRGSVSAECMKFPTEEALNEPKVVIPKTDEARHRINKAIQDNLLFRNLDLEQKTDIINAMFERKVVKGEMVIQQGDPGDNFYVVDSGHFDIFVNGLKKAEAASGGSFGELALMYNTPRAATIVATEDSILWAVDRMTFRKTIILHNYRKRRMYEGFLRSVPLLETLGPIEISKVADCLEPISFKSGEVVVSQGDPGNSFYIVVNGEATVTISSPDGDEQKEVNKLGSGDYFGELALLNQAPRAATVIAITPLECVSLDANVFTRLFGPLVDIMKRNMNSYMKFESACKA